MKPKQFRQIHDQVSRLAHGQVGQVRGQVNEQVHWQVNGQVYRQVYRQILGMSMDKSTGKPMKPQQVIGQVDWQVSNLIQQAI